MDIELSRSRSKVLAHLRTLRMSLAQARDLLLHYKEDRVDRDRLEPGARRVDDLMNMFTRDSPDSMQGAAWVRQILAEADEVTNPKAAAALDAARADIAVLIEEMSFLTKQAQSGVH